MRPSPPQKRILKALRAGAYIICDDVLAEMVINDHERVHLHISTFRAFKSAGVIKNVGPHHIGIFNQKYVLTDAEN